MGLETDTVGVIVPVRGDAPFLRETLEAILAQEPAPADVVVVDDASPDPIALPDPLVSRCRLVRREVRGGPAGARQTGLEALRTPLVALCDSDDVWEAGKLAAQRAALAGHPNAALCFGRATVVGPDGAETGEQWEELPPGEVGREGLLPMLYERAPIPTSSVLVRRDAVQAAGGFDSDVPYGVEDWDLWLRLVAGGGTFVSEPAAGVRYRRHASGLTADLVNLARGSLEIHKRHGKLVKPELRALVYARDLTTLARGFIRRREYASARAALKDAWAHAPPSPRERVLAVALRVPVLRAALGRRSPYPTARS
jgi:glycosyltransferase involved in cell wall biosynthesis